ncbi:hypothetical protein KFL_000090240 [Klebsormidium nitens]|uniref:Transmembrane protein n=1 Tax=Klebsormidium nitens TaxID=105231 RepID=A0A1Y1HI75_KLENI|nr:hypothetical protein KFL_000090240 [Klebsormidium nitens]|eukprot:GAQ78180.1 hypothetical protein KFL_000090240 [Klebsormidium nitens]
MAASPPLIVFLSIVSLSVSLSCSALFLTVLLTSCTRAGRHDPLRQQALATTDPLFSFWGAAQELPKLPPETSESAQGVNAVLGSGRENARAFQRAEGKEMPSKKVGERFEVLRDRFADWLTRLQEMLRARALDNNARGHKSAIEKGCGNFVPEVGGTKEAERNEEDVVRCHSKGPVESTGSSSKEVAQGKGDAKSVQNDASGGSSAQLDENRSGLLTDLATPAPLKRPFVFDAHLSKNAAISVIKDAAQEDETKTLNPAAAEREPPRLAGLKASAGRLEPEFNWETERYDLHVPQDVKEVRLTPVLPPGQDDVSIYVSDERTANNTPSGAIRVPESARRGVAVPIILKRGTSEPQSVYVVKIFRDLEDTDRYQWRLRLIAAVGLGVTLVAATSFLTYSAYMWDKLRREHLRAQAAAEAEGEDEAGWLSE